MGGFICVWYMEVYLGERLGKHRGALTVSFICRAECLMGNWKLHYNAFFFFNEMFFLNVYKVKQKSLMEAKAFQNIKCNLYNAQK